MKWALVNAQNIVENIIMYDGESPYEPKEGYHLRQVNDWIKIGYDADLPLNDVPKNPPADPVMEKKKRDEYYSNDLAMIALFDIAKKANPQLEFSAYLDSLEQLKSSVSVDVGIGS